MPQAQSQVSKENLAKVEYYFVSKAKELGTNRITATVKEIADGSMVALATAHKAIRELDQRGVLDIINPPSRRFPITYIYKGDIENFEQKQTLEDQNEYLRMIISQKDDEINELKRNILNLQRLAEDNVLHNI